LLDSTVADGDPEKNWDEFAPERTQAREEVGQTAIRAGAHDIVWGDLGKPLVG
jgi:hypothetical protein